MTDWRTRTTIYGKRGAKTLPAEVRLSQAYRAVFMGSPSRDDQHMVLADLAGKSGFYGVSHSSVSADHLRQREGMRELFSHIFRHISLSDHDMRQLENAARIEMASDNNE